MTGYGISGIGFDPFGGYGLSLPGMYTSYPTLCGMGGYGGYNPSFSGMGMGMGMYSPEYMMQWGLLPSQVQNQVEMNQLIHSGNMQGQIINNDVQYTQKSHAAIIQKIIAQNPSIMNDVENLGRKVSEGDTDGANTVYLELRDQVIKSYGKDIENLGSEESPCKAANEIIMSIYNARFNRNLEDDINKNCDSPLENGFFSAFKPGWHKADKHDVMHTCFNTPIDHKESNRGSWMIGNALGRVAKGAEVGALTTAGTTVAALGAHGLIRLFTFNNSTVMSKVGSLGKWFKYGGKLGMFLGGAVAISEMIKPGWISNLLGLNKSAEAA